MFEQFKDKEKYCVYYKYLSMAAMIMLLLNLIATASAGKIDWKTAYVTGVLFITYFQSRLLYTMCLN
jgi:hypothetical protein